MLEKIKLSVTSVPFAGEHRAKDIVIEGLERIPDALYYMEVQSTDGKNYEIKIPEDAESVPIDGSMAPLEGFLKVMLLCKSAAGDVIEKSKTENFRIHAALMNDGEILPDYKTVKSLAEKVLAVPEQIQEFVGTIEEVRAAGEAAVEAAARAEQVANGSVADGAVTGIKLNGSITNLFNPDECTIGVTIEDISGTEIENAEFMITGYIPCVSGNVYYCPGGNRRRGIWYNANKEPVAYNNYGHYAGAGEITAPSDAVYMRLSYGITSYGGVDGCDIECFMVTYGGDSYPDEYIPYGGTVADWLYTPVKDDSVTANKLAAKAVTADKLDESAVKTEHIVSHAVTPEKISGTVTNKLSLDDITAGKLSPDDGTVTADNSYMVSAYINIPAGQEFVCPQGQDRCICYYDEQKQYLSSDAVDGWQDGIYTGIMPEGTAYLRVSYKLEGFAVWPMLCLGTTYPDKYVPYGDTVTWLNQNPLKGRKLAVLGDSLSAWYKSAISNAGYFNGMDYDRAVHNQSVWGSPVARHNIESAPASFVERFGLLRDTTDYLVIQGGVNDCGLNIPVGLMSAWDDFTGALNEYTFIGALESLFRQAQAKYPNAKILFFTSTKLLHMPKLGNYMDAAKLVCNKYSIPVLDLYNCSSLNQGIPAVKSKYFNDDTHPNDWGHLLLTKTVERFLIDCFAPAETAGMQLADVKSDLAQLGFETGNLFNKETVTRGSMILNNGSIGENSAYCYSDYIPVKANKTYCVSYAMSSPGGMYDVNKNYIGKPYSTTTPVDYHTFTPTQNGFVRLNLLISSKGRPNGAINGFIMSEGMELLSYPPYGEIVNKKLALGNSQIQDVKDLANESNTLYGKNLVVFGDSRTWYDGHSYGDKTKANLKGNVCVGYQQTIKKMIDCNIVSEGVSGNTSAQICERIVAYDFTDVDAVLLEGGVNDFVKQSSVTVGEISAIGSAFDASTVYGAWQTAIEYILTNYPTVKIYMTIPAIAWTSSGLFPYGTASIKKEIAELYNLPIVDLYKELGINEVNRDTFYCDNVELTNWRLHFNDYGNAVVGEKLAKFILNN